ncbi:MAG TPA: hypothetical protein VNA19_10290 [Pyrinomonadaceae bacterium]|jgi:Tfp pilus assembly protein PilE|nr:hypothetical protein [Pyrinomonadaceae bacterium]
MSEGKSSKRWLLVVALVAGGALLALLVVAGVLVGIAVPAWRNAVVVSNETAVIRTLKTISNEQQVYLRTHGRYATFEELYAAGALDARFNAGAPLVEGYTYTLKVTPPVQRQTPFFSINADPEQTEGLPATGKKFFYLDSRDDFVRFDTAGTASATDPILE